MSQPTQSDAGQAYAGNVAPKVFNWRTAFSIAFAFIYHRLPIERKAEA